MKLWGGLGGSAIVVLLAGFGPAGSCAKACGRAGRSGADDVARRSADDWARAGRNGYQPPPVPTRYGPRGTPVPVPVGGVGHAGDEVIGAADDMTSALRGADGAPDLARLEARAASHPPVSGADVSPRVATRSGPRGIAVSKAGRFRDDLGMTVTHARLDGPAYDDVLGAFLDVQDIAALALDTAAAAPEDETWALDLELAAGQLDRELDRAIPDAGTRQTFHDHLGPTSVIVYRLATERPLKATK